MTRRSKADLFFDRLGYGPNAVQIFNFCMPQPQPNLTPVFLILYHEKAPDALAGAVMLDGEVYHIGDSPERLQYAKKAFPRVVRREEAREEVANAKP